MLRNDTEKTKKTGFIDIHSHIMQAVDDGAKDMEESIAMLHQAKQEGITAIILTSHQKPTQCCVSVSGIQERIDQLCRELEKQDICMELYAGSELFYSHDLQRRLINGEVCTLAGSAYVLVEFFPSESWQYIRDGLYRLVCTGYRPIVAHAERYVQLMSVLERLQKLVEMGCYIKVNADSVMGEYGFGMKRKVRNLLKAELVHFVTTDAHREHGNRSVRLWK